MSEYKRAISQTEDSANITQNQDYLVIKGNHYIINGTSIKSTSDDVAIKNEDILSINYIKFRSYRQLIVFAALTFAFVFSLTKFFSEYLSMEPLEIIIGAIIVLILLFSMIISCMFYITKTYDLLKITAIGITVAVEKKYYNRDDLNQFLK